MSRAVLAFGALVALAVGAYVVRAPGAAAPPAPQKAEQAEAEGRAKIAAYETAHPESHLHLTKVRGELGGFGSVLIISGAIQNDGTKGLIDPLITCTLSGNSGTKIDEVSERLFERLAPGDTKRFSDLNMGLIHSQAKHFECHVAEASLG